MSGLRILIVDDSGVYRRILSKAVENALEDAEIIAVEDGLKALEILSKKCVDACLLDVNMPVLNGIETLKRIKTKYSQLPVIMVSGDSKDGAKLTVQALGLGALDFIVKPLDKDFDANMEIISRHLKELFNQIKKSSPSEICKKINKVIQSNKSTGIKNIDLVVIASSTGGPSALEKVIPKLSGDFPKPVLIVQHMPPEFTKVFSESLNKKSKIEVAEAKDGDLIVPGKVFIAPGGFHMKAEKISAVKRIVKLDQSEFVCGVRPSADVLFASAAQAYEKMNVLAVVLTGMGKDGTAGVAALKGKTNCHCITQSEATCVVYGMPRSVSEIGLSDEVSDIDDMAEKIEMIVLQGLK